MKERPQGGTGRAGALRPGQNRALLAGPEAHEGLGLVLTRARAFACIAPGGRSSVLALVCPSSRGAAVGKASPPRGAPPAQALAGNPSVLMRKGNEGREQTLGGPRWRRLCPPPGPATAPGCGFSPRFVSCRFFGGRSGSPTEPHGQEGGSAAPRPRRRPQAQRCPV